MSDMKLIMENWRKFLNESLNPVVYHFTSIHNLYGILKDNKFATSVALGSDELDKKKNKSFYFFSTTRIKNSSYARFMGNGYACLVLNGRKLNNNYRASAVDYWGAEEQGRTEAEDRIFTIKPYIENAIDYILEIHIGMDIKESYSDLRKMDLLRLKQIETIMKENNISIFIYTREKDFLIQNKRKALFSVEDFLKYVKQIEKEIKPIPDKYQPYEKEGKYKELEDIEKFIYFVGNTKKIIEKNIPREIEWLLVNISYGVRVGTGALTNRLFIV
jgi:hypothetical protein